MIKMNDFYLFLHVVGDLFLHKKTNFLIWIFNLSTTWAKPKIRDQKNKRNNKNSKEKSKNPRKRTKNNNHSKTHNTRTSTSINSKSNKEMISKSASWLARSNNLTITLSRPSYYVSELLPKQLIQK